MLIERRQRPKKAMQLTALIDVLFQLLIFFMLSTSFVRQESIELALPSRNKPKPTQATPAPITWRVEVAAGGQLKLNGASANSSIVSKQLQQQFGSQPDTGVLIISARGVNLQELVAVMDMIYLAGGKNVAVSNDKTRPVPMGSSTQGGSVVARVPMDVGGRN